MTPKSIKVSATEVLRLLAGEISVDEFRERNRLYVDQNKPLQSNPFLRALKQGRAISGIRVEHHPDFDDDWLVFDLSEPDAALTGLRVNENAGP